MSDVKTRLSAAAPGMVAIPLSQTSKIQDRHHDRLAVIYVRQSSPHQVIDHPESTARQYALVERAIALGWERDRILIIDDDLGKSGRSVEGRLSFIHKWFEHRVRRPAMRSRSRSFFGLQPKWVEAQQVLLSLDCCSRRDV